MRPLNVTSPKIPGPIRYSRFLENGVHRVACSTGFECADSLTDTLKDAFVGISNDIVILSLMIIYVENVISQCSENFAHS